jgi:K+-sensing histidine kinase KdpD
VLQEHRVEALCNLQAMTHRLAIAPRFEFGFAPQVDIGKNVPAIRTIYTDLYVALSLLIGNAYMYGIGPAPFVKLCLGYDRRAKEVRFCVENPGAISDANRDLFKRREVMLSSRKDKPQRGYGLLISRRIIERLGGRINLQNATTKAGNTVRAEVFLPLEMPKSSSS